MSQQTIMAAPMPAPVGVQSASLLSQVRDLLYGEQNINGTLNGQMSNIAQDPIQLQSNTQMTHIGPSSIQQSGQYMQPMYQASVIECPKVNLVPENGQQSQHNMNMNNMNRIPSSVLTTEQCKQPVYTASSMNQGSFNQNEAPLWVTTILKSLDSRLQGIESQLTQQNSRWQQMESQLQNQSAQLQSQNTRMNQIEQKVELINDIKQSVSCAEVQISDTDLEINKVKTQMSM